MDIKHYLVVVLGSFAMIGSVKAGVKTAIVKLNEGGPNYLYSAKKISPGDTIHFQLQKDDQPFCCGQRSWKAARLLAVDPDAIDYGSERTLYRYRLDVSGISTSLPFLGIAVIGNKVNVEQDGAWRILARQAGTATDVRLCTSQEGIHVISQSAGKPESHLYIYLGYDIDNPTCAPTPAK